MINTSKSLRFEDAYTHPTLSLFMKQCPSTHYVQLLVLQLKELKHCQLVYTDLHQQQWVSNQIIVDSTFFIQIWISARPVSRPVIPWVLLQVFSPSFPLITLSSRLQVSPSSFPLSFRTQPSPFPFHLPCFSLLSPNRDSYRETWNLKRFLCLLGRYDTLLSSNIYDQRETFR